MRLSDDVIPTVDLVKGVSCWCSRARLETVLVLLLPALTGLLILVPDLLVFAAVISRSIDT